MFALIQAGIVRELFDAKPIVHPDIEIVDCSAVAGVAVGWACDGMNFTAPVAVTETPAELNVYAKAKQQAVLATGWAVNVNAGIANTVVLPVLCDGTNATRADLAMLALYGQQNPAGTKIWLDNNGVTTILTGTQMVALATAIGTWVDSTYATLGTMLAGIAATPATVTTTAQIDTAFGGDAA